MPEKFSNNKKLRRKISYITDRYSNKDLRKQLDYIGNLKSEFSHSIEIVEEWKDENPIFKRYNCFSCALNLKDSEKSKQVMSKYEKIYTGAEFVNYLKENNILNEIRWGEITNGDIIIYYDDNRPKHAGNIKNKKVISKWGTAHLWEHDIFEIPEEYGDECKYFTKVEKEVSEKWFLEYARVKGAII